MFFIRIARRWEVDKGTYLMIDAMMSSMAKRWTDMLKSCLFLISLVLTDPLRKPFIVVGGEMKSLICETREFIDSSHG